jgi:hypothetical protein
MKVEFNADEVNSMLDGVIDQLLDLKLGRTDTAAIRRWRTDTSPGTGAMQLLTERVNDELQREHDRSEVSPIKKPDWAS